MPTPRAVDPGYKGVHMRLSRERGPASEFVCPCGSAASEWSYNGGGAPEYVTESGRRYSTDLSAYTARCRPCHRVLDNAGSCRNGHPFTPENSYRYRGEVRCRTCRREYMRSRRARTPATVDKRASGGVNFQEGK